MGKFWGTLNSVSFLDRCQNFVFIHYLENKRMEFDPILYIVSIVWNWFEIESWSILSIFNRVLAFDVHQGSVTVDYTQVYAYCLLSQN